MLLLRQSIHTSFEPPSTLSQNMPALSIECSAASPAQVGLIDLVTTAPRWSSSDGNKRFWGFYYVHHITRLSKYGMQGNEDKNLLRKERQTLRSAQLPLWLLRRRIDLYTSQTHSGWDCSLSIYNVRPSDAPIFRYANEGNIDAIKRLFQGNMASPYDVDEDGYSLLHVS